MKARAAFTLFLFVVLATGQEETGILSIVSIPNPESERANELAKLIVWLLFLSFFQRTEMDTVVAEIHGAELFFSRNRFLPVEPVACVVQRAGSAVVIVFVVKTISFSEHSFDFLQQTGLYLFDVRIWHDSIRYLSISNSFFAIIQSIIPNFESKYRNLSVATIPACFIYSSFTEKSLSYKLM